MEAAAVLDGNVAVPIPVPAALGSTSSGRLPRSARLCALAPAGETRRRSSSSPTVRIKRRAERSLARGPSDPQGPGLGYNEAVRFAPLLAAPLAPNPRERKGGKKTNTPVEQEAVSHNIQRGFGGAASAEKGSRGRCTPHVPHVHGGRQLVCFNSVKHPCGSGSK